MSVTIKDVAKKANVSISTVSRVINDSKPVSEDIKKRVFEVIEELGYIPNPVARNLVMKTSKLIGVIVPDISKSFVGEMLNAVEDIAKTYDYDIVLCNTYGDAAAEARYFELLQSKQAEGIIFVTRELNDTNSLLLSQLKIPIVLVNRDSPDVGVYSVTVDPEASTYDMINYLIGNGHRSIGLIRAGDEKQRFAVAQTTGYRRALAEHSIPYDESLVFDSHFNTEKVYDLIAELVKSGDYPTAIFAVSDDMAISAINAIVDHDLTVPGDISVSGAFNSSLSRIYRPQLTTVNHPIYDMGAIAIRMIIKAIGGQPLPETSMVMPHEIIERQSTRAIK